MIRVTAGAEVKSGIEELVPARFHLTNKRGQTCGIQGANGRRPHEVAELESQRRRKEEPPGTTETSEYQNLSGTVAIARSR